MDILPEPPENNEIPLDSLDDKLREYLKQIMGEDGITFLNLNTAINAVKKTQLSWQAPFAIGLWSLPFVYEQKTDNPTRLSFFYRFPKAIDSQNKKILMTLTTMVFSLSSQVHISNKDEAYSNISSALDVFESIYNLLISKIEHGLSDEQEHILFHVRFAFGILLLINENSEKAERILREMAETKMKGRGSTWSSEGLEYVDVAEAKALAAIVLHGYFADREDYSTSLTLLIEAISSNAQGYYSNNLLIFAKDLIESFAEKCENQNNFLEWVDLFDLSASIIEICGEADVSGELPSDCKISSPQFWAWKFGQLVARFANINRSSFNDNEKIVLYGHQADETNTGSILGLECGGYGDDWLNGTVVASLLLEFNEHQNWPVLLQQYISMWNTLSRYQWLSICKAGTHTDLYWAMRIGFANKILTYSKKISTIKYEPEPSSIARDVETTKDIASTIALRQLKLQQDSDKMFELVKKLVERQPPDNREIIQQMRQRLGSIWDKLPTQIIDTLVKGEKYYVSGIETDNAKVWFNRVVEASLEYCLEDPLIRFMEKRNYKNIAICFPRGIEYKNSFELHMLSVRDWSKILEIVGATPDENPANFGLTDFRRHLKECFGDLSLLAIGALSRSLLDFCQQRKDAAHTHKSRHEKEFQELELMRGLILGIERPSIITQIIQLFCVEKYRDPR